MSGTACNVRRLMSVRPYIFSPICVYVTDLIGRKERGEATMSYMLISIMGDCFEVFRLGLGGSWSNCLCLRVDTHGLVQRRIDDSLVHLEPLVRLEGPGDR